MDKSTMKIMFMLCFLHNMFFILYEFYFSSGNVYMEPGVGDINVMVKPSVLKDKTPMCLVNELARYNRVS